MSKARRQETVAALTEQFRGATNIYVTDFAGLDVAKLTDLRRRLRQAGARYLVVKNTLAQRALTASQITVLNEFMSGPTGLVLAGDDPLPAAKVLGDFAREHQKPAVRAGLVDGRAVDPAYVTRLGSIPSREVLLGQLAGCLNGVLYQVVGALEALAAKRQAEQTEQTAS
jgi:large subunit ribosomal protein L10